jgi:predicted ferric reductase
VERIGDSLKAEVTLPRPWKVRPGQYIYLTLAGVGLFSLFQRHPFMVLESPKPNCVQLHIEPRNGFTRRLFERSRGKATNLVAFIEGPYGRAFDPQEYGTVVLLASGIGIVGHLASMQDLTQAYRSSTTKTRDLLVIWHVENDSQARIIELDMNRLLETDREQRTSVKANRTLGQSDIADDAGKRPAPSGSNVSLA